MLVGRHGNRRLVTAVDRAATEAGLRVGMPATKAQALVQGLAVMDAEPEQTRRHWIGWPCGLCGGTRRLSQQILPTDW